MTSIDIAVVGFSFKLPQGIEDETSAWDVFQSRKNLMTEWPEARTRLSSFYDLSTARMDKVCQTHWAMKAQNPAKNSED